MTCFLFTFRFFLIFRMANNLKQNFEKQGPFSEPISVQNEQSVSSEILLCQKTISYKSNLKKKTYQKISPWRSLWNRSGKKIEISVYWLQQQFSNENTLKYHCVHAKEGILFLKKKNYCSEVMKNFLIPSSHFHQVLMGSI